ncbi:GNAT family N-acetyltransferase [Kitasatospora sp. NPDC005751]|uniref:GNAT family N-acetyltransferase n=1 Tax=Kitasatospora sp. NPDC005751 TaxID=3157064 RepID=UPI0033E9C95A
MSRTGTGTLPVRRATAADAAALFALSEPSMASGELRRRRPADYRSPEDRFLLVDGPSGPDGCVALRLLAPELPAHPAPGLVHNFCVREGLRGAGLGSQLLDALLDEAGRHGVRTLVTASTGGGALFRRYGFEEIPAALAPRAWAGRLDPARRSLVFLRTLEG